MYSLSKPLLLIAICALAVCPLAFGQGPGGDASGPYGPARALIAQVQGDLDHAQQFAAVAGKQRERYDTAHRHLAQFDDALSHGGFDGGKLDQAIGDVNAVFKNNVLSPKSRDDLRDDLDRLRAMRTARGRI